MKKILTIICLSGLPTLAHPYYNTNMNNALAAAEETCSSNPSTTFLPNAADGGTYFECTPDHHAILNTCPEMQFSPIENEMIFPYMTFNISTHTCDAAWNVTDLDEHIANNDYPVHCSLNTPCDCRDNPHDTTKTAGICACAYSPTYGFGFVLDYSTCVTAPSCTPIKDITNTDRATIDPTTAKCYAPTGYTFADDSGKFKFTSNCYEN